MSRKGKILLAILGLAAVLFCALLAWRMYETNRLEKIHRVIQEAWNQNNSENMPEYLTYIDLYSDFGIEKIEKGDPWVVTVRVRGVDLAEKLKEADLSAFTADTEERKMDRYLVDLVIEADLVWVDCDVYLYPEGDDFRVQFSDTFVDAMSGMLLSYARELTEEAVGGAK